MWITSPVGKGSFAPDQWAILRAQSLFLPNSPATPADSRKREEVNKYWHPTESQEAAALIASLWAASALGVHLPGGRPGWGWAKTPHYSDLISWRKSLCNTLKNVQASRRTKEEAQLSHTFILRGVGCALVFRRTEVQQTSLHGISIPRSGLERG